MALTDFEKQLGRLKVRDLQLSGQLGGTDLEDTFLQVSELTEAQVRNVLTNFKTQYRASLVQTITNLEAGIADIQARITNLDNGVLPI